MLHSFWTMLYDLPHRFRPADAVDIAIITVFLYSALVWFLETTSRRVATGVTAIIVLYFVAVTFNLYLTSQLLHTGFAIALIALVVIFQDDLRRAFERLATVGTWSSLRVSVPPTSELDTLVEVAFAMAAERVGALIVVQGHDDLDRHIHGGIPLAARVSKPLLESIFDPHSAGHDGAVIIRRETVDQFGVHLPISQNRPQLGRGGTRHAAALGISERCDAAAIVVSEERGTVSVAEGGRVRTVESPADLKGCLEQFAAVHFPLRRESPWKRFVVRHWPLKAIALSLSMLAWGQFAYNPSTIERTFLVPIEYRNVPDGLVLGETAPAETHVTLSGSEPAFRLLDPAMLSISVDLAGLGEGRRTVEIQDEQLSKPSNLNVDGIEHRVVPLELHHRNDHRHPASGQLGPG